MRLEDNIIFKYHQIIYVYWCLSGQWVLVKVEDMKDRINDKEINPKQENALL